MWGRQVRVVDEGFRLGVLSPLWLISDVYVAVDDPGDDETVLQGHYLPHRTSPVAAHPFLVGGGFLVHPFQIFGEGDESGGLPLDQVVPVPLQVVGYVVEELVDELPAVRGDVVEGVAFLGHAFQELGDALQGVQSPRLPDGAFYDRY